MAAALTHRLSHVFSNFNKCLGVKEQLLKENEELKKQREELDVRVTALKSQYEGRLSRQERELRDLRGQQERQEQRDEPPEAGPSKVRVCFVVIITLHCIRWSVVIFSLFLVFRRRSSRGVLSKGRSVWRRLQLQTGAGMWDNPYNCFLFFVFLKYRAAWTQERGGRVILHMLTFILI